MTTSAVFDSEVRRQRQKHFVGYFELDCQRRLDYAASKIAHGIDMADDSPRLA
jgi:hypothetical protein